MFSDCVSHSTSWRNRASWPLRSCSFNWCRFMQAKQSIGLKNENLRRRRKAATVSQGHFAAIILGIVLAVFYSNGYAANNLALTGYCSAPLLPYSLPEGMTVPVPAQAGRIELEADTVREAGGVLVLSGNAVIRDAKRIVIADEIIFDRNNNIYKGMENVQLIEQALEIHSKSIVIDRRLETFVAQNAQYHVYSQPTSLLPDRHLLAFGVSESIEKINSTLLLNNATVSNCKDDKLDIKFASQQIELNLETYQGKSRKTAINLQNQQVITFPTLQFPIGDHRQSGYLFPSGGYNSKHGGIVRIPYYYNLAPNYDAAVSYNVFSRRGIQLESEVRHLGEHSYTTVNSQVLPDEKHDKRSHLDTRYGVHFESDWHDDTRLYSSFDVKWISDKFYLRDFSGLFDDSNARYLKQSVKFDAIGNHYSASLGADKYVLATTGIAKKDRALNRMPWFRFQGKYPVGKGVFLGLDASHDKFSHRTKLQGKRTHTDTFVELQNEGLAGRFNVRLGTESLGYQLSNTNPKDPKDFKRRQVSNSYYIVDGRLFFDSNAGGPANWTLEPRIQFVGSKRIQQNDMPLFDTAAAKLENYDDVFATTPYVGRDRIRDIDRMSAGVSISDSNSSNSQVQRSFGIGRMVYSKGKQPSLQRGNPDRKKSDIFAGAQYRDSQQSARVSILYDDEDIHKVVQTHATYTRAIDERGEIGTIYRYLHDDDEQAGFAFKTTVANGWEASYLYASSLKRNRSIESSIRFEYESCCWTGGVQIAQEFDDSGERDNSIEVYFRIHQFDTY